MSRASSIHPRAVLLQRLAGRPGWQTSADLFAGLPWAGPVLEDALADLVTLGGALYNSRARQYRMAGEPAQRAALLDLMGQPNHLLSVRMLTGTTARRIGIARRLPPATPGGEGTVVTAEIEIPTPANPAEAVADGMAIAEIVRRWCDAASDAA